MKRKFNFHFIANAALGKGLSGGDRIFIELARRWSQQYPVTIYVWEEGYQMCCRQKLSGKKLEIRNLKLGNCRRLGFALCYLIRTVLALVESFKLKLRNEPTTIIYSSSDFWMDSLPGWILKKRFPKIIWIGTFYLAAPNPLIGFYEKGKLRPPSLKGILYWLMQQPIYWLLRKEADLVFVTSEPDMDRFPQHKKEGKTMVVRGGVNLEKIRNWKLEIGKSPKVYDAVFQGRFHPMKGVLELVEVWKRVVKKFPQAKLAMIGDGPLRKNVESQISNFQLQDNIKLFGYVLDGPKKDKIFRKSKIILHPALYDSGGMAAAEGMAWGLPAVGFDLRALRTYYPKGMLKAKIGDLDAFASLVIRLLSDKILYQHESQKARDLIFEKWDWDKRAKEILERIEKYVAQRT